MVRVSLKNTFLTFDEGGSADHNRGASPRARSVEAIMSPIRQEDDDDCDHNQVPSNAAGSRAASPASGTGVRSPIPPPIPQDFHPPPRRYSGCGSGHSSPFMAPQQTGRSGQSSPLPGELRCRATPEDNSATGVHLRQLQTRLEQLYGPPVDGSPGRRSSHSGTFHQVSSNGSISTMAQEPSGSTQDYDSSTPPRGRGRMPQAWSSNSLISMGGDSYLDDGPVEFNLNIEEEPQQMPPAWENQRQRAMKQATGANGTNKNQNSKSEKNGNYSNRHNNGDTDGITIQSRMVELPDSPPQQRLSNIKQSPGSPGSPDSQDTSSVHRRNEQEKNGRSLPKEYRHGHVPKNLDLAEEYRSKPPESPPTTLMIRNIPNRYTQRELIIELEALGFTGTFDFLYVPLDKGTMSNVGYAFVNFIDPANAAKCMQAFHGYRFKRHRKVSGKIAAVSIAHIQGLEANLAHYKNAAVNTAKMKQRRPLVMANISQSILSAIGAEDFTEKI